MADYLVQGKKGNGKSLVVVNRIQECLIRGAPVATNLDLNLVHLLHKKARKCIVMRVPDKPTVHDLMMIGRARPKGKYDESKFGVLALDECATWLNTRSWAERGRKETIDYFVQTRKEGWDLYLLLQSVDALESQARESCGEHIVTCRRLDRIAIPFFSMVTKLFSGIKLKLPRVHAARVQYDGMFSDRWVYRGEKLFRAYDTEQKFRHLQPGPMTPAELKQWRDQKKPDYKPDPKKPEIPDMDPEYFGTHCLMTPWLTHGRYMKPWTKERVMRLTQIYLKRFTGPMTVAFGCFLGLLANVAFLPYSISKVKEAANEQVELEESALVGGSESVALPALGATVLDGSVVDPPSVADTFAAYTIAAHVRGSDSRYYLLKAPEGGTFTDEQIVSLGYRVAYVSECELMIMAVENLSDKTSIFQPGCVPKPANHQPVDLTAMPNLAKKAQPLIPVGYGQDQDAKIEFDVPPLVSTTQNPL